MTGEWLENINGVERERIENNFNPDGNEAVKDVLNVDCSAFSRP